MNSAIPVVVNEDDSVQKKLQKTARQLEKKFQKKRKINEKALKEKSTAQKVFSILFDCLAGVLVIFAMLLCFSSINSTIQNVCPTFFGYSNLTVLSGSMVNSGFRVGDNVVIKSVNPHTLHENDIIAFYVYSPDYSNFDINACVRVDNDDIPATQLVTSLGSVIGMQPEAIRTAGKAGATLVFHHIRAVFEDENGTRWFKTYGSSNAVDDPWYVSENMVVGIYTNSSSAKFVSALVTAMSSDFGVLFLIVPILLLGFAIVSECVKDVALTKLELDCVEEKRKITDEICVKNDVGFNMDAKTKYKILAQVPEEQKSEYIALLWRDGKIKNGVRKYYLKRKLLLKYDKQLLLVNRECEKMLLNGEKPTKIAKFYITEKTRILNEKRARELRFKQVKKLKSTQ